MKTLAAITAVALAGVLALNPPPLGERPGEGAEPASVSTAPAITASQHGDRPQTLPQGSAVSKASRAFAPAKQPREAADDKPAPAYTFATIDITIDPQGKPLGAYQFELTAEDASFTVVGVEQGGHPAFDHGRPPYYDRVAMRKDTDKLIVAEYALAELDAARLPTQPVRVATVHVMVAGAFDAEHLPTIKLTLTAAGDADGNRIDAQASHALRFAERPE